jgi:hypothetical protein
MKTRVRLAAAALAVALAVALAAGAALAQMPATVHVDDVRVTRDGRHRVTVSVVDEAGSPLAGLERAFRVTVDGAPAEDLVAESGRSRRPEATVTVVLDATLLRGESLAGVQEALRTLGRKLPHGDRLAVVVAGAQARSREEDAAAAGGLAQGIGALAGDATPLLYDALYDAARAASRLPQRRGGALLVVTRGADGGSRRTALDVHAMARSRSRVVPVMIVLLDDGGASAEGERLRQLAAQTGGSALSATSAASLPDLLPALAARALDRWVLSFRVPGWDRARSRHAISLAVEHDGARRSADDTYDTADALPEAWWRSPLPWLSLLAVVLVAGAAFVALQRRQQGLLVHDGDAEDGVWYEVFAFPVTVGGADGNDIVLANAQVSRNHAVLERRGRIVELADLNSENGTFVNGERIVRRVLADGDRVSLGPAVHLIYEARG